MRLTTVFRGLLGVTGLFVEGVRFGVRDLVVTVRPRTTRARCGRCRRKAPAYDRRKARRWRHLGLGRMRIWLEYAPRRVDCKDCGVTTEAVPWATGTSRFTQDFEEMVAYLARLTDKTQVTRLAGISWSTVGAIVERVVNDRLDPGRLKGLRRIGIDEFSYRKRHKYLTVVVDHDRGKVVWAGPGRSAEALSRFFEAIGRAACEALESVTIDMAGGYQKAIREAAPRAQIIFDRFHVQRLASDAVDAVRREQLRDLRGTGEGKELFRSRFSLLKNPWNLTVREKERLAVIEKKNKKLYRAYLLKEMLAHLLDYSQPWRAERALREWLAWASRSKLKPFVRAARTIRKHFDGIMAYVRERLTNGVVEGTNNLTRMIARRAFGFHSPGALISMIYLCCAGIPLDPPLPGTHQN